MKVTCARPLVWAVIATSGLSICGAAFAQRGTGQNWGVARWPAGVTHTELNGRVKEVVTEPCEKTTGRSLVGAHFVLEVAGEDGQTKDVNIHLGPATLVQFLTDDLKKDATVKVAAFRTDRHEEDHYVAKTVTIGEKAYRLRQDNLRPVWAGGRRGWR